MRELQKKQKLKRRLYSAPSLVIMAVLSFFLAKSAYGLYETKENSARERALLLEKVEALKNKEGELGQSLSKLASPKGLEEEIKSKFNVARVGEHVAIIVEPSSSASTTGGEEKQWFERFLDAIIFWK